MIGIYKITSPTDRVYIGQSINIKRRFKEYSTIEKAKKQRRLYASFCKHGFNTHVLEVITECKVEELDRLEMYYIDLYNSCLGNKSLNCNGGGKTGGKIWCKENRDNFKENAKRRVLSEETKQKLRDFNLGKKHKPETIEKLREIGKKMIFTKEHRMKISEASKKQVCSKETRVKMSQNAKSNLSGIKAAIKINQKPVINTVNGDIFESATLAAKHLGIPKNTLIGYLNGDRKNKTNLKYI